MSVSFNNNFDNWYTLQGGINSGHSKMGSASRVGTKPYSFGTEKTSQVNPFSNQSSGLTERMDRIDSKVLVPSMKSATCGQALECWA